jgi:hypothetical protein
MLIILLDPRPNRSGVSQRPLGYESYHSLPAMSVSLVNWICFVIALDRFSRYWQITVDLVVTFVCFTTIPWSSRYWLIISLAAASSPVRLAIAVTFSLLVWGGVYSTYQPSCQALCDESAQPMTSLGYQIDDMLYRASDEQTKIKPRNSSWDRFGHVPFDSYCQSQHDLLRSELEWLSSC